MSLFSIQHPTTHEALSKSSNMKSQGHNCLTQLSQGTRSLCARNNMIGTTTTLDKMDGCRWGRQEEDSRIWLKAFSKDIACKWLWCQMWVIQADMFASGSVMAGFGPQKQHHSVARVRLPSIFKCTVEWLGFAGCVDRWRGEGVTSAETVKALQVDSKTIISSRWQGH